MKNSEKQIELTEKESAVLEAVKRNIGSVFDETTCSEDVYEDLSIKISKKAFGGVLANLVAKELICVAEPQKCFDGRGTFCEIWLQD